jgi:hypothetical protein
VLEDGVVGGRIFFLSAVAPEGRPWMWASGHSADHPTRGARLRADARREAVRTHVSLLTTDEILHRLEGLTFAQAAEELGIFSSYERATALIVVMARAPTAADRVRVFLDWGNLCDAPWWNRSSIADMLRQACAEISLPDLLNPADRRFYDLLPRVVEVWRGCEHGRERGPSWTTDRATAAEFAQGKRCRNKKPTLVRAEIPKEHIFAVFTDRQESEIVLDPRRLRRVAMSQ